MLIVCGAHTGGGHLILQSFFRDDFFKDVFIDLWIIAHINNKPQKRAEIDKRVSNKIDGIC